MQDTKKWEMSFKLTNKFKDNNFQKPLVILDNIIKNQDID